MSYTVTAGQSNRIVLHQTDREKEILQNVAVILSTPKGSVPNYREFGVDATVVDRPLPVAKSLLVSAVTEAVERFEPRARVVRVTSVADEADMGRLIPTVEVEIVDE